MAEVIVDQSDRPHVEVTGADRVRFLQGMCTANVETLAVGAAVFASMLTAKGRVVTQFEVVKEADRLLLLCEPGQATVAIETLSRYAIMDEVELAPIELMVHRRWPDPAAVLTAPPIFAAPPSPSPAAEVEVRRIEGGFPRYGIDVSEANFPFETPLGRFIDYEKGCYIGQEPISRVHFRGSANKQLRGLHLEGDDVAAVGSVVSHESRADAGVITSAARSEAFGSIALAYLHRSVWEPGNRVAVAGRPATVVLLPFGQ